MCKEIRLYQDYGNLPEKIRDVREAKSKGCPKLIEETSQALWKELMLLQGGPFLSGIQEEVIIYIPPVL